METITYEVTQGLILGPLLAPLPPPPPPPPVNDLHKVTKYLDLIMLADDANFFYSYRSIKTLSQIVNSELKLVNEWYLANKISLKASTNYISFIKCQMYESVPLQTPTIIFNNIENKRKKTENFLGFVIDENATWKKSY